MPQVVSDPTTAAASGIVSNGGTDLFSYPDTQSSSIIDLQIPAGSPAPAGTSTSTGLLTPDLVLAQRLKNFPSTVYDLSSTSVLTHFMQALVGDSGVGQIRKRQQLAMLQSAVTSTHFYDLDSFYGALFGAIRGPSGTLPTNPATGNPVSPYTDLATPDAWDEVLAIDAQFRERIIQLARAITLGGTVPGLRALAEAITGSKCQVFEVWRLIDNQGAQSSTYYTWAQEAVTYPSWSSFVSGTTWQTVTGQAAPQIFGGLGINSRAEIVITPTQTYSSDQAGQQQQASDAYGIASVVEVLHPANTVVSVEMNGVLVNEPVIISAIWADSNNAELIGYVTPAEPTDPAYAQAVTAYQPGGADIGTTFAQPSPVFCRQMGAKISYAGDVTVASGQSSQNGYSTVLTTTDYDQVTYPDGSTVAYTAASAVLDPATAAGSAASASVQAAPYSGPRVPVMPAG
jgi:hypothetical protein